MRLRARVLLALVPLTGLVASACGGSSSGGSAASTTQGGGAGIQTTAPTPTGATVTTTPDQRPASIEKWEALWTQERAAVVKRIKDSNWGTSPDGSKATGPAGFVLDLAKCPAGWKNTEGLTDNSIKVGYVLAQSGSAAAGAGLAKALDAVFKHQAGIGGFKDSTGKTRTVELTTRDDGYDPARTIPLVDELIDSQKVFTVLTSGTPPTLRTYDKLNQRCIPQPLTGSGHSGMGDPVNHPWTTSAAFSYGTEAIIWGAFIEKHLGEFGGKAKVAFLKINNDGGTAWETAFKAFLAQSTHKDDIQVKFELHEPTAATITEQMTTLAAYQPNFLFMASTGTPCSQVLTETAQNGMKESVKYKFLASTCKATGAVTKDKAADTSDGWWSAGGGMKDIASHSFDQDPWVVAGREWLTAAGYDYKEPIMNLGLSYAWTLQQGLLMGGDLPGGLTRSNLMIALRSMDMTNPQTIPGIKYNMNGSADAFLLEGSDISQWSVKEQAWMQQDIIDLSGKTKNCAWDQAAAICR